MHLGTLSCTVIGFERLLAYQKAYELAMEIFEISKSFPAGEKYSLTDQIRKSSRSVCANFAEAFSRRKYPAHFISKLTDADGENCETAVWLNFAKDCQYLEAGRYSTLRKKNDEVGRLIGDILKHPDKYR